MGSDHDHPKHDRACGRSHAAGRNFALLIAWLVAVGVTAFAGSAEAHGIAGNRLFPGTITFDDPAVTDELVLPAFSHVSHPAADGHDVTDNTFGGSFSRLLTPTLLLGVDSSWTQRERSGFPRQSGFGTTTITLKNLLFEDDPHETLISASLGWGIAHSGAQAVDEDGPTMFKPGLFFGRGFGDLPDSLSFLRPFGIAGAISADFLTGHSATAIGVNPDTGRFGKTTVDAPNLIHWGFALEFSTLYLTDRFTGGPPTREPLDQFVPLVEFAFDTPFGAASNGKTSGTMNPGLAYVAETWQVSAEAIVPLDREAGRGVGARAQVLLFLDDLLPALFGKPLLRR